MEGGGEGEKKGSSGGRGKGRRGDKGVKRRVGWVTSETHKGASLLDKLFHFTGDGQLMTEDVKHRDEITPLD